CGPARQCGRQQRYRDLGSSARRWRSTGQLPHRAGLLAYSCTCESAQRSNARADGDLDHSGRIRVFNDGRGRSLGSAESLACRRSWADQHARSTVGVEEVMMPDRAKMRTDARAIWDAAVAAADPSRLVRQELLGPLADAVRGAPRIIVVGGGKAGSTM